MKKWSLSDLLQAVRRVMLRSLTSHLVSKETWVRDLSLSIIFVQRHQQLERTEHGVLPPPWICSVTFVNHVPKLFCSLSHVRGG